MTKHIVLDIETLGLRTDAVIESIGLVMVHDSEVVLRRQWFCSLEQPGRTCDTATIAWRETSAPVKDVERLPLRDCLVRLASVVHRTDSFWSWRNFDFRLLAHAFEQFDMETPWRYDRCFDIPSYFLGAGKDVSRVPGRTHDALEDAELEANALIDCWKSRNVASPYPPKLQETQMLTPLQKLRREVILDGDVSKPFDHLLTGDAIDAAYSILLESDQHWDSVNAIRSSGEPTGLPCDYSRHYESMAVARKCCDGTWVGWTYWYGGGKHSDPDSIAWMDDAYDVNVTEEQKMVTVRTFGKA